MHSGTARPVFGSTSGRERQYGYVDTHSELRLVTCLFVEVIGSTDATVRLGPERVQRLLGDAFAEMTATDG